MKRYVHLNLAVYKIKTITKVENNTFTKCDDVMMIALGSGLFPPLF